MQKLTNQQPKPGQEKRIIAAGKSKKLQDRTALEIVFFAGKALYGAKTAITALKPSKN